MDQLARFPMSGGRPRELSGTPYRQLVINPLRLFYRVAGEEVFIVYVMRGEQQFRLRDLRERSPGIVIVNPDAVAVQSRIKERFTLEKAGPNFDLESFSGSSRDRLLAQFA